MTTKSPHAQAMEIAERMTLADLQDPGFQDSPKRAEMARQALALEVDALHLVDPFHQPSYSVLARSVATLAVEALDFPEALRLVELGMRGNTPEEIRRELLEVREQVRMRLGGE